MSDESWTSCGNHARPPDSISAGGVVAIPEEDRGPFKELNLNDPKDLALLHDRVMDWPACIKGLGDDIITRMVEKLDKNRDHLDPAVSLKSASILTRLIEMNQKERLWIMDAILNGGKKSGTQMVNLQQINNNTTNIKQKIVLQPITLDEKD